MPHRSSCVGFQMLISLRSALHLNSNICAAQQLHAVQRRRHMTQIFGNKTRNTSLQIPKHSRVYCALAFYVVYCRLVIYSNCPRGVRHTRNYNSSSKTTLAIVRTISSSGRFCQTRLRLQPLWVSLKLKCSHYILSRREIVAHFHCWPLAPPESDRSMTRVVLVG